MCTQMKLLECGLKQPPLVRDASSKAHRTADSTDCGQPTAAPDASSVRETAPLGCEQK